MFFQSKIKNETRKETGTTFRDLLIPKIDEYLSEFKKNFKREIPKIK